MSRFPSSSPSSSRAFLARLMLFCSVLTGLIPVASGQSQSMSSWAGTPRSRFRIRYTTRIQSRLDRPVRLTSRGLAKPSPYIVNLPSMVI